MDIKVLREQFQFTNFQSGQRITILGAGIAGLVAAYELERLGHEVEIMEGSSRIGGRVWTHRFGDALDAPYAELGAMRIPSEHELTLHYVEEMGLSDKLCKFMTVFEEGNAMMNMQGKIFRMKDAPRILQNQYQGILTDTRYSEKTRLFAAWLKTIINTIAPGQLRAEFDRDLSSHLMDELERLDLEPFFSEDGETIDLHSFLTANPSFRAKCSQGLDIFLGDIVTETSHDLLQLHGGMDQLIQRLAASIKAPIYCNREVVALRVRQNQVEIEWKENGQLYTQNSDYVLCTIPFSVLRKMELSGFDDDKLDSIHNTVYCPGTKVAFHTRESFWSKDGIKGGASFSGEGVRQTYYPSVKFNPNSGSVMLASYTIGDDAERMAMMSESERFEYVQNVVSKIHPELNTPGMIVDKASIAWGNYKWSAGGCTVHWDDADGQINYLKAQRPQNTLFFAGEHCSRFPAWLQGSIESALEAVYDILKHKPMVQSAPVSSAKITSAHPQTVGVGF
ncbi:MAG: NAD(P)/FAD-dependent oxidoreductase [Scytonema sp. PMC 1069.18]|nr:NAD(P)/FAD-dependent oxidoreductase [Scytonema sp. PMC 1069.18]MEC4887256.1 NAD(P)/FAD-dependent oxidoreductase [Scytonema sp. PMC 1070.18]